jgi:hypothetical protein
MPLGKGFAFSALGALIAAIIWVLLIKVTDWNLWILAPVVGGAAGYGMMRGTQMKGGIPAGIAAAAFTLIAIFGARYFVVSGEIKELAAVDSEDAMGYLVEEVAEEWAANEIEVYSEEEGDYLPEVYASAQERWDSMSQLDQQEYIAGFEGESEQAAAILTPFALLFDFGIFGTLFAAISAGSAFKLGSITLEEALVQEGHAADAASAGAAAARLRAGEELNDAPVSTGSSFWTRPLPPGEDGPNLRPAQQADITPGPKLHREAA